MAKRRRMSLRQLKTLIETGHYRAEPTLVAEAMLERPGVRAFLTRKQGQVKRAGQSAVRRANPAHH
jgi:hypothetical protein